MINLFISGFPFDRERVLRRSQEEALVTAKENEEEVLTLQPRQGGIWEVVADEAVSFYAKSNGAAASRGKHRKRHKCVCMLACPLYRLPLQLFQAF